MVLKNKAFIYMLTLLLFSCFQSCGIYSFSGINIADEIKTISIQTFYNEHGGGPPDLSQRFTESLKDYYQQNTRLAVINEEGDLQLDGSIVGYTLTPIAPTASGNDKVADQADLTRFKITVKVNYIDTYDESQNFEKTFSFYADFDPEREQLEAVQDELIKQIFDQIILDIFNETVADW